MVCSSIYKRVVDDHDSIVVGSSSSSEFRGKSSSKVETSRRNNFSSSTKNLGREHTGHLSTSLISNNNNIALLSLSLNLCDSISDTTSDESVDTAAKSLIRGKGNDESFLGKLLIGNCFKVFEMDSLSTKSSRKLVERLCKLKTIFISLKLCSGNHLHGTGNLPDILGGLDLVPNLLLGSHTTSSSSLRHKARKTT